MLRPSASRKRLLGLALALSVGTGAGVGAASIWSASGATTPQAHLADAALPAAAAGRDVPGETPGTGSGSGTAPAPASSPLTLEEAMAVATETAPGRVVEWDEDQEPTGLRYDVTVLHEDRTTTEVEVDAVSGQVTSIDHDDDLWG